MPRTSKNNGRSKKSNVENNSSDQKENRPKKIKANNDAIPMSKQLLMKKKNVKNKCDAKRQCKNDKRTCGNGKIMPSLADLEKMYEDSDNESNENTPKGNNSVVTPETDPIVLDTIFSPTTRSKITEQAKEILSIIIDLGDEDETCPPPKKRLKFDRHDCELNNLTPITATPNGDSIPVTNSESDIQINNNYEIEMYQDETRHSASNNSNILTHKTNLLIENENLSDHSSDSNKTIEYKINPSMLQSESVSQTFCPLPSTSKDSKIFIKNDELFNKSLRESSANNIVKQNENVEIPDISTETIVIDDEVVSVKSENDIKDVIQNNDLLNNSSENSNARNHNTPKKEDMDLEIIEIPTETILIDDDNIVAPKPILTENEYIKRLRKILPSNTSKHQNDNDDCIYVQTNTVHAKKEPVNTDITLREYDFVDPVVNINNNNPNNMEDDVIDVDDLIAQNQTILEQFIKPESENLDTSNLVVDVDVSTIAKSNNNESVVNNTKASDINSTQDVQNPISNNVTPETTASSNHNREVQSTHSTILSDIILIPDVVAENRSQERPQYTQLISQNVANFFTHNYRPDTNTNTNRVNRSMTLCIDLRDLNVLASRLPGVSTNNNNSNSSLQRYMSTSSPSSLSRQNRHRAPKKFKPSFPYHEQTALRWMAAQKKHRERTMYTSNPTNPSSPSLNPLPPPPNPLSRPPNPPSRPPNPPSRPPNPTNPPSAEERSGNLGDCPICMDTLSGKVIASTICGHVFCMRCLQQSVNSNKRCPTCRKILKKNGYHQIYL